MDNNSNIPIPDTSGSDGSQTLAESIPNLIKDKPLESLHMVKTIEGLATTHAKSLGGEVVMCQP